MRAASSHCDIRWRQMPQPVVASAWDGQTAVRCRYDNAVVSTGLRVCVLAPTVSASVFHAYAKPERDS